MTIHDNTGDLILAATLNEDYVGTTLSHESLQQTLDSYYAIRSGNPAGVDERAQLFARTPYFVSRSQVERMIQLIGAVESVLALPAYRACALAWAPDIAQFSPGPLGIFFGYDFHLHWTYPQLIEINTNAGGALLNSVFFRTQQADETLAPRSTEASVERSFIEMFRAEWRLQRGDAPLTSIAIVDVDPERQFLHLEFQLFRQLFQNNGIASVVADPSEMVLRPDGLWCRGLKIDLVYNRLTDFSLDEASNAILRDAYLTERVVLTPHPRAHALYADKRNLALLTDETLLRSWAVPESTRAVLRAGMPRTVIVTDQNSKALWSQRRRLFFKPAAGYGSKATYRGDKLTRRAWEEVRANKYVAQELVPPSQRFLQRAGEPVALKVDVRNYVYDGRVQLLAARMYQGQTTNFRTAGGGFAAVLIVDDARQRGAKLSGLHATAMAGGLH